MAKKNYANCKVFLGDGNYGETRHGGQTWGGTRNEKIIRGEAQVIHKIQIQNTKNAKYKIQNTKHKIQDTNVKYKCKIQNSKDTKCQIQNTKYELPNTKNIKYQEYQIPRIPNTKYKIPITKYQIPDTKYQLPITKPITKYQTLQDYAI